MPIIISFGCKILNVITILPGDSVTSHGLHIHNWPLQPLSQVYDLTFHTTYVVCVNFINGWQELQFKDNSEKQIFEKLFMAILFTHRVFDRPIHSRTHLFKN